MWTFASAFALQHKYERLDLKARKRLPAMQMQGFARFGRKNEPAPRPSAPLEIAAAHNYHRGSGMTYR
jgi:hypothetical protein